MQSGSSEDYDNGKCQTQRLFAVFVLNCIGLATFQYHDSRIWGKYRRLHTGLGSDGDSDRSRWEKHSESQAAIYFKWYTTNDQKLPNPEDFSARFSVKGTHINVIDDDLNTQNDQAFFRIARTTSLIMCRYKYMDSAVSLKLLFNSSYKFGDEAPVRNLCDHIIVIEDGQLGQSLAGVAIADLGSSTGLVLLQACYHDSKGIQ